MQDTRRNLKNLLGITMRDQRRRKEEGGRRKEKQYEKLFPDCQQH